MHYSVREREVENEKLAAQKAVPRVYSAECVEVEFSEVHIQDAA
jgi:hypothetical protein